VIKRYDKEYFFVADMEQAKALYLPLLLNMSLDKWNLILNTFQEVEFELGTLRLAVALGESNSSQPPHIAIRVENIIEVAEHLTKCGARKITAAELFPGIKDTELGFYDPWGNMLTIRGADVN